MRLLSAFWFTLVFLLPLVAMAQEEADDDPTAAEGGVAGEVEISDPEIWLQKVDEALEPRPERRQLSIGAAREDLLEVSTNLKLASHRIDKARILKDQAMTVWFPTVTFSANYTLNDKEIAFEQPNAYAPLAPYLESVYQNDPSLQAVVDQPDVVDARDLANAPGVEAVVQPRHQVSANLNVTQPLFDYRAFTAFDRADVAIEQAENAEVQTVWQLERSLIGLYFNAVQFKRLIKVSERNLELARINYERQAALFEEGAGIKFEVNRSRVALANALRDLENARLSYDLSIEALASLLEAEPDFDVVEPDELDVPEEVDPLIENALQTRPSLEGYALQRESIQAEVDDINSVLWPTLDAFGNVFLQRETAFGGDFFRWNAGLQLRWVIYDGGIRNIQVDQVEVEMVDSQLEEELERINIETELRQSYLSVRTQERNKESALEEAALAAENVELTEVARDLDAATVVDVELAQRQRFLSEIGASNAEIQLQAALYELYHLAGYQW